ncbi:death-associated inhibitor of apoptosis 2-like [Anopheles maculipalpis]|uniref:death-associated inhibitor of apoptosis 2-like n=1 Tax=Anopheles maculipalpis TaxID=1496333 RepID=UPI002158FCD4|nr:death-associated inhibitor of apoptosis 2-like [Anopheles maculipalpis]
MSTGSGLGIQQVEMPYMPEYASLDSRLRSFRNWTYGHVQDSKRLAEAGFYYAGVEDEVRCFHCDGGLRDWLVTDDPWHEHARCFAGCSFLQLVLGETYISQVLLNGAAIIADEDAASTSAQQRANIGNASSSMLLGGTYSQPLQQQHSNELTHQLKEENNRLKEERECKICLTREVGVVFCPCGHLVSCVQCAPAIYNCPVCRALITGRIRTYLS